MILRKNFKLFSLLFLLGGVIVTTLLVQQRQNIRSQAALIVQPVGQTSGNWNLIFDDEFDGTTLDTSKWVTCYFTAVGDGSQGCSDTGLGWALPQNAVVSNGALHLITKQEQHTGTDGKVYDYTSGMVTSGRIGTSGPLKFSFAYGYAEIRAKVPGTKGFWPAFWAVYAHPDFNTYEELDYSEILTKDPKTTYMTYHVPDSGSVPYTVSAGTPDFSQDYHIFAADWQPGQVIWYVDGIEKARFANTSIASNPMYLLLTMGPGACTSWAGCPDTTTIFPSEYTIDYVRVWQLGTPVATPTPTPTPAPVISFKTNSGGLAYTDSLGNSWSADNSFTGGITFTSTNAIANTLDPALYQSQRFGNFSYNIPVQNGTYDVTLKFAEIYWTTVGKRVFNVSINGTQVLTNFDILSSVAPNTALDKTFTTPVTTGNLNITFTTVTDNAEVNAIQVVPAISPTPTSTPIPTPTPTPSVCTAPQTATNLLPSGSVPAGTVTLSWSPVPNVTKYQIRVDDLSNGFDFTCVNNNPGDVCDNNVLTTSYPVTIQAGHSYNWLVLALNSCGAYSQTPWVPLQGALPTPTPTSTPLPTPTPTPPSGLLGSYFNGTNFNTFVFNRIDSTVNFDWGTGSPDPLVNSDMFSVRWTGYVVPTISTLYTFYTYTDDGVRLWVNNNLIIDQWHNQSATEWSSTKISLQAGIKYPIKMEFYENTIFANASLSWSTSKLTKQVIPTSVLKIQ